MAQRHKSDFYPTPPNAAQAAIRYLADVCNIRSPESILDVGAGPGIWGDMARQQWPKAKLTGIDIRALDKPDSYDHWFSPEPFESLSARSAILDYDLIIGNPPFSMANPFVFHALSMLPNGGTLAFLLGLQYLGSDWRRLNMWGKTPLQRVAVGSDRIQWTGGNNPNLNAMYIWQVGNISAPIIDWFKWGKTDEIYREEHQLKLWEGNES